MQCRVASFFPAAAHLRHPRRSQTYVSLCALRESSAADAFFLAQMLLFDHAPTRSSLEFLPASCLLRLPPPLWKNKYMFHARPLMHQIISLITAEANNDAIQETIKRNQRVGIYDSAFKNFNKTRSQIYRSKQPLTTLIKLVAAALFLKGFIVCVGVQSLIFVWFAA